MHGELGPPMYILWAKGNYLEKLVRLLQITLIICVLWHLVVFLDNFVRVAFCT